jgi:putative inorganic carbon (HCO3(-)) transporter
MAPFLEDRFRIPKEAFFWLMLSWNSLFWLMAKVFFPSPGGGGSMVEPADADPAAGKREDSDAASGCTVGRRAVFVYFLVIGLMIVSYISWLASGAFLNGLWEILILQGCVFFFFMASDVMTADLLRRCLFLAFWAGVASSCYSLLQHLGIDPLSWKDAVFVRERTTGTLGNPNFLGAYLAMILPIGLLAILEQKRKGGLLIHLLGWGLAWMALLFSLSRAAWVAFIVSCIFFASGLALTGYRRGLKKLVFPALIVLVSFLCLPCLSGRTALPSVQQRVRSSFDVENEPNLAVRLHLWKSSLEIIKSHPVLGTGPGTFSFAYLPFRKGEPLYHRERMLMAGTPHNVFLETASNTGVPSLLMLLGIVFLFFRYCLSGWSGRSSDRRLVCLAAASSGAAFWSGNLFGFSTLPTTILWWFLLAASCHCGFSSVSEEGAERVKVSKRAWPMVLAATAFLLSAGMSVYSVHALKGNYYFGKALSMREEAGELLAAGAATPVLCERAGKALEFFSRALLQDGLRERYWMIDGKFQEEWGLKTRLQIWVEGAVNCYRMALKLNPLDPYPLADLGRIYGQMALRLGGKYRELSVRSYREALGKDPYNAHFWKDLGNTLVQQGLFREAEEAYLKSLEIAPGVGINLNLGLLYRKTGERVKARRHFEEVLRLEPGNVEARRFLENDRDRI